MKVVHSYPPNIEEIKKAVTIHENTIYTYGNTIYNPSAKSLSKDLFIHEQIHMNQQKKSPADWWKKYLEDVSFRLSQELEAYRAQLLFYRMHHNYNLTINFKEEIAKILSSDMYGNIITFTDAMTALS